MSLSGAGNAGDEKKGKGRVEAGLPGLSKVVIGKDILELVSSAMYIDPMTVYREYIQNAADAVDAARSVGILSGAETGRVDISVDAATRTVKIRDNGYGIPSRDFWHTLTALGGSTKRGSSVRGFRGVGRLAGLAYAQELLFRSRSHGETEISELKWDCRQLKAMLREASDDMGVAELIREVTSLEHVGGDACPKHFFEVEMRGIIRLRDDRLVSPLAISEYLSQVAPTPFSPEFIFGRELSEALSKHMDLGELNIRINDAEEPIYRPHRDQMDLLDSAGLTFSHLDVIELPSVDNGIAAVAWVLHHEYEGALPNDTLVKGLRVRTGNMQVGGHTLLEELFPEQRFNSWSVGEVHVFDRRIVPNGRRDQFEPNIHYYNLLNHLAPTARDIARRCRTSSVKRKHEREFELCAKAAAEMIDIVVQGGASQTKQSELAISAEQSLLRMTEIINKGKVVDRAVEHEMTIQNLRQELSNAMNDGVVISSPLMRLPEKRREVIPALVRPDLRVFYQSCCSKGTR